MLEMKILISEVDYSAISERFIPMLLEKMRERDEDNRVINLLSRFAKLPGKAAAAALNVLPQSTKDDIAVYLVRTYDRKILSATDDFFKHNNIPLCIKDISVDKSKNIEMSFRFEDIAYGSLIGAAYPRIANNLSDDERFGRLFGVLDAIGDKSEKMIQAVVEALSQEEKDELTICVINTYEPEILSLINALASENEIKLTFDGIEVRKA